MAAPTTIQTRNGSTNDPAPWNYLWQPGKYPQTEEEMCAAAKKYGMIREDYVPYPDNGNGMGDYPDIGRCGGWKRPGMKWWDDEDHKRDFGQVMQFDWYQTLDVGWNPHDHEDRHTPEVAMFMFLAIAGSCFLVGWLTYKTDNHLMELPVIAQQDPWSEKHKGKKWYTFEKPE